MMKRGLIAFLVVGVLAPATVNAAPVGAVTGSTTAVVLFHNDAPSAARDALRTTTGARLTRSIPELDIEQVSLPATAVGVYEGSPFVQAVEPARTLSLLGTPNDPLVGLQWPLRALNAFKAWRFEKPKANVTVAVIDTGVDAAHVDLEKRILPGFDFLEQDEDPYDDNGHGTHVSGIIAANTANHKGIAGLSAGARIVPIKACTADGACPVIETYAGVVEAVRRGAAVINMSLGGAGECSIIDQTVYDYARDQGVLVVVAAGNSGADKNPVITPASCDNTLGVGATDDKGRKAGFSSYGFFVDIAAPGVDVWSTMPPLVTLLSPHLGYAPASGTSMASPFVAAAAASVLGRHPDWSPAQVEERLLKTSTDAGTKGRDDRFGEGILNLLAALR
jgi:subtilisin family serine protease